VVDCGVFGKIPIAALSSDPLAAQETEGNFFKKKVKRSDQADSREEIAY